MEQKEKIIYRKRFTKIDLDNLDMTFSQQENPDLKDDIQKPSVSFDTFYKRMVANSIYVIKPERVKHKQRFIDLAITLSTDFEIDMDIKEGFYYVTVTMYLLCATCTGSMKSMIAELVSKCDRISSFTSKTDLCDFIISLDYYTHDHYVFDRKVDY